MGFKKFGHGTDQKVDIDKKDDQGIQKSAKVEWTPKDTEALKRENEDK